MPPIVGDRKEREGPESDLTAERAALRAQLDRVQEEKRAAREAPGASWREWWFYSASKWYILLGFVITDIWVGLYWEEAGNALAATLSVVALLYGEFLLYQYLWFRPVSLRRLPQFRPTWWRPVRYGRWTPEAEVARARGPGAVEDEGPDLKEFV
jgi:hypothetical protein